LEAYAKLAANTDALKQYMYGDFEAAKDTRAGLNMYMEAGTRAHKRLQDAMNKSMMEMVERTIYPAVVVGVDPGKPGGDHTAVVTRNADGTHTIRTIERPVVGWRHKSGTVVQEDGRGGYVYRRADEESWKKFPGAAHPKVAAALNDPKMYTPIYEGEALFDVEARMPLYISVHNGKQYRYDIRRHSVLTRLANGQWYEAPNIKPPMLNDRSRFQRVTG
jgi:hypothetical protein